MNNKGLTTIWRSVLRHSMETVLWIGPAFGVSPTVAVEVTDTDMTPASLPFGEAASLPFNDMPYCTLSRDEQPALPGFDDVSAYLNNIGSTDNIGSPSAWAWTPPVRRERSAQATGVKPAEPLTEAERDAWISLVDRLR